MLRAAIIFFIFAMLALFFAATGFANVSMDMGKPFLVVFLTQAGISFLISLVTERKTDQI